MSNIDREYPPTYINFVPRQVAEAKHKTTGALSQDGPKQVARASLQYYLDGIAAGSRVHDNGSGDGNVTRLLLSELPRERWPKRLDATDIAPAQTALGKLEAAAAASGWPVHTAVMEAQDLAGFEAGIFDTSVANCVLYRLPSDIATAGAREIHRTLVPGGTAVVTGFGVVPHRAAIRAAHRATRPADAGPLLSGNFDKGPSLLEGVMRSGGFTDVTVYETSTESEIEDLAEWESSMWAVLGRPLAGWLVSNEERWDEALRVFDHVLRQQPGFRGEAEGNDGKRRVVLTNQAWIAVARK